MLSTIINATAPLRVCDLGGWTDTWFAGHGKVLNLAVAPLVEVQLGVGAREPGGPPLVIHAENYGDRYEANPSPSSWDRHPLLEAAVRHVGVPDGVACELSVYSHAPAGASTGTSASVTVAVIGALERLTSRGWSQHAIAMAAHQVETVLLEQESGIQDQLCAAYGGASFIDIDAYPDAHVTTISLSDDLWSELDQRLILIYLGRSHRSSAVHDSVIGGLADAGPGPSQLDALRKTAYAGREALERGDLAAFGQAMSRNTEAQACLHAELVSADARHVMAIAMAHGALGCKVNGAGGDGGSLSVLCGPDWSAKRAMIRDIESANPLFRHIPTRLSRHGLRVWESAST